VMRVTGHQLCHLLELKGKVTGLLGLTNNYKI